MKPRKTPILIWSRAVSFVLAASIAPGLFGAPAVRSSETPPEKRSGTIAPKGVPRPVKPAIKAKLPAGAVPAPKAVISRPATPVARPGSAPAAVPEAPAAPSAEPLEFADAFPSEPRPPAPDLLLAREAARKAEAQAAFAKALVAEDNAEADQALAGYRRVLELDPGYADLAVKVAYELARRNDVAGGIQVLKDAIKASPKEPLPLIYLSQLYSKYLKKPDLAMKYAEQAMALAPENFNAHLAIYELHIASGEPKRAEAVLDRAAKIRSIDPRFWIQLGDLSTRLYLKEDGSSQPEQLGRMNAIYRKAAELGSDDATIQSKVGDYFVLSRQVKEAIPFYRAALNAPLPGEESPLHNLREKLARAFLVTDQRDEALQMLEQIARENPMRYETYELLGELYEQKGETGKALAAYEQSLLLDGSRPDNYLRVAEIHLREKNAEKAVEVMKSARAKFPDLPQITFSLAATLSQARRHTEAMTAFAEAQADAEHSQEELLNAAFYFRYGAAAEQAGLMDKAAELLREAIRLDPSNAAQAYNYLGYMWADRDMNLEEAGEMIKKALEMEPDNGAYIDSLGWLYYKKGEFEKALKELLRAAEAIKPEDSVVFDHLGDVYQKLGRTGEALNYWQKAIALDGANEKIAAKIEATKQKVTQTVSGAEK